MWTVHGGLDDAELRAQTLTRADVVDFSSNVNPLGASRLAREAAAAVDLSRYPDRECLLLREALAARVGVSVEQLMIGNGSTELIHLLARARMRPRSRCVIFAPTFGEYAAAAGLAVADVEFVRASESDGFNWSIPAAVRAIGSSRPATVFLCNPNNPTGVHLSRDQVRKIHKATAPTGVLALDDAYAPFADQPWDTTPLLHDSNLVIIRSMTKDHALAGVRLGYLVADPDLILAIRRYQPSWSVNAMAQQAGLAALEDPGRIDRVRACVSESKEYLYRHLDDLGIRVVESAANFVLVRVGDAAATRRALLRRRIVVRDCSSFGLPDHIRIAVRRIDECGYLVKALREVIE